ncbi:MAG: translation elongation factor Ts [Pseudomonadota bacterium]|jgi:elongation factor Ts|nr:translation elongation factor Ts [Pseudomonadales bacterium]MEC7077456.1 translation elongation factor Ts [Pseudomonadota bacterium]MEC7138108.1 translation elongation factor Ts [Pseudomonadota bacterium]MEC7420243.1 translation elongation factor Ts [Pseudomonadota bacterium]MEC7553711.1 translation elongation factor Ts [Pseudomonadota bacterium]
MAISAAMVKELRERTGLGMMDCKRALTEAGGDMEKAIEELRKKSALKAAKKAGRTTANGLLGIKVADDGSRGAIVEINIETDFAAKNEKFIAFVAKVTEQLFDSADGDLAALSAGELNAERETLVQEIGENITIRRGEVLTSAAGGISQYMHGDQRRGALVDLTVANAELGRDVAMHVVAINPMVVRSEDVAPEVLEKEREIFASQAADSGKPEEIVVKMVEGRVKKFLAEVSLLDQPFVKDGDIKVSKLLADAGAEVASFVRYEVGEGIEVEEMDFAAEVAAQVAGND